MSYQKSYSLLKNMFFAFTAICFFASCQDEEITGTPENAQTAAVSTDAPNAASLTILEKIPSLQILLNAPRALMLLMSTLKLSMQRYWD
jgi:hypothetical protein